MKREEVLFYLSNNKIHIYLKYAKKELIKELDTTSFFEYGEISDVKKAREIVDKIVDEGFVMTGIFKPNIRVLYNDITHSDLKELYKMILVAFNYGDIEFIGISKLLSDNSKYIIYDENYYTILKSKLKLNNIDNLDFEPIIIGKNNTDKIHYSDKYYLWNKFKSHFTN